MLTVCGPSTYQLLKSLLQPASRADKTYDELVQTLSNHFNPAPSAIVQRFKFNTIIRKSRESVVCYVAELKTLREHSGFGIEAEDEHFNSYLFQAPTRILQVVLTVHVNKAVLPLELDTKASLSVISEGTYKSIFNVTDQPTDVSLHTYIGEPLAIL